VLFAETRSQAKFSWRDALSIGLYTAIWANLHASFFLAAAVAAIYAVGRRSRWFAWAAAVAALAPLANPYGWRLYQHIFSYLTDSQLLARIAEYQSFDF